MQYNIDTDTISENVDALISQAAAREFSEDGTSLFENIIIHSNEWHHIKGFISQAQGIILTRFNDCARTETDDGYPVLQLYLPHFDTDNTSFACSQLDKFITNYCCAEWCKFVLPDRVEYFNNIAQLALETAVKILRTRINPKVYANID